MSAGAFGPRLQATVALLAGRYRLSRREVADLCGELLVARLAVGSVDHLCQATGAVLAEPVAHLEREVQTAPIANADETGWKQAGQRGWLWVVVTTMATVFAIARSRGSPVIRGLLGEGFPGYLGSDRWSAYSWVPPERRQGCWAHLRRDFQALVVTVQRGLVDRVHFVGQLDDVRPAYAAMDLFLFLAWCESFGLVLCEAMAAHVPVFGLAGEGEFRDEPDAVVTAPTAVFVDRTFPAWFGKPIDELALGKLATLIGWYHDCPSRLRAMTEAAHERVREHFTEHAQASATQRVYDELYARAY